MLAQPRQPLPGSARLGDVALPEQRARHGIPRNASRSDSAPSPRARQAIIAHSVSASVAPQLRTLTRTAPSSSSNRPCRRAVGARIEEPPYAVRFRSVKFMSTFGGRIFRVGNFTSRVSFRDAPIFAYRPCGAGVSGRFAESLSGNRGLGL